jgi:hypothetical protein
MRKRLALALLFTLSASSAAGAPGIHTRLDPRVEFEALAELAADEHRAELPCQVAFDKPSLGFDLRFHSEYHLTLPLKVVADASGWRRAAMRITPKRESDRPVYVAYRFVVPDIVPRSKADASLTGGFDLGPGQYRVEWFLRDGRERVCSAHQGLEARTGVEVPLTLGPNQIVDMERKGYAAGQHVRPDFATPLRVKILLNVSPSRPRESIVRPEDATVLFSMLRGITGQPWIALSTLVAFNLREQRVLYQDEDQIDFVALEKAMQSPTAGTVDIRTLRDPQSETHFVTELLTNHLGAQADSPDAIIIVGLKVTLDRKVPLEPLPARGAAGCPVFYLNYNSDPKEPWTDTIGSALKAYRGASAYNVTFPSDMGMAMKELLSRIAKRPNS